MYTIRTTIELNIGEYLDLDLREHSLLFVKNGEVIFEAPAKNEKIFQNRILKGVVVSKKDHEYEIQVVRFADLHRHSGYSLLDGASKIEDIVAKTEYVGALTDHGNMFGFLKYYKAMKNANKQPIIGFEAYAETIDGKKESNHLVLLAKNFVGYKNITKLTSLAYENFYSKPHVTYAWLEQYREGVIALSACLGGEIPSKVAYRYNEAKQVALRMREIFGDDFYLEIQNHHIGAEEDVVNAGLMKLAKETGIKLVATTDSHYTNVEDSGFHEVMLALATGRTLSDPKRMKFNGDGYHVHSADDMDARFAHIPEAIDNTLEIAQKCADFKLKLNDMHFPKFEIPEGYTEESYFEELTRRGFEKRFAGNPEILANQEYRDRLELEISTIKQMGFAAYFLIVWDFINYAKERNIMVGPGRGSAVGSLVSYSLALTDLDPMPYGLLFERFLNTERVTLPDIDVDFCFERRKEVIDYVRSKYGEDAVSSIVTIGTFAGRSAVRDVTRVMEFPYSAGDEIAKAIPLVPGMTIAKALTANPELQAMYNNNERARTIIDGAMKIEGLPRHSGTHACGIVISDTTVDDYMPEFLAGSIEKGKEITTQVTMSEVEELGLLKFDFLGLKTMSVIGRTLKQINKEKEQPLKLLDISLNNPYIYEYISTGKTEGTFQLESSGMRNFMKDLYSDVSSRIKKTEKKYSLKGFEELKGKGKNPDEYLKAMKQLGQEFFERLIAGIALYRPGPLDYIPNYLNGIKNPKGIKYLTPKLEPILRATYGTIVYQEQVMQIVQSLAGYSLGRADIIRRAMGKKKIEVMEQEKHYFIHGKLNPDGSVDVPGCIRNGIREKIAEEVWEQMADFSKYAFNKSHAAAYAMLGAVTAWLKKYHPAIYMAETINIFSGESKKLRKYLHVINEMGIKILPPNVNVSGNDFSAKGNDIIFGLGAIKFMGQNSDYIISERMARGEFRDLSDLVDRMLDHQQTNKRALEGLIYSGALDMFPGTRRAKIEAAEFLVENKKKNQKKVTKEQISFWDMIPEVTLSYKMPETDEFDKRYRMEKEKEFAGFYVTEHPLDEVMPFLKHNNITNISELTEDDGEEEEESGEEGVREEEIVKSDGFDGKVVDLIGIVNDVKTFYSKKTSEPIKSFQLEDKSGSIKCVMFSKNVEQFGEQIFDGNVLYLTGTIRDSDFGRQVIVDSLKSILAINKELPPKMLYVKAINANQIKDLKEKILDVEEYSGRDSVYVSYEGKKFKSDKKINVELVSTSLLRSIFTDANYRIVESAT